MVTVTEDDRWHFSIICLSTFIFFFINELNWEFCIFILYQKSIFALIGVIKWTGAHLKEEADL